ncbi:hypothetical protein RSK20926_20082 [Roseobacter sp. SK209-2-6]|uniref:DSD1 family PLP-dependent enzyme n=1 Tax=Roseobacter sp. SK209-2-6 TaxID=388739 RepID=UPI0000F3F748|nr:DSD1 family PLP-dependent enzyme [Roseobacter sp. SK209-2-6]EBA18073.1 hypothetical protein RSK20926_20082 [Roseobacter sp. SK209-2-6]
MLSAAPALEHLPTPSLVVDEAKMRRNIKRQEKRVQALGVTLRPHLKTVKSVDIARQMLTGGTGPATVSTLEEAEIFAAAGIRDIIYAVGIVPQKLDRVAEIRARGCDLAVLLDSPEQAKAVASASRKHGQAIPALIEVDCDGHRSGTAPGAPELIEIGHILEGGGACLRGVLTHAGESYAVCGRAAHAKCAEAERRAAVRAVEVLSQAGLPCPVVSIGSTPTAHAIEKAEGITEIRAGVFAFFDLFQAGIETCSTDDIALSVLTTVLGQQRRKGWIITDAGWMALSQDRGTASQRLDQGYGVVCDEAGRVIPDLIVSQANQEHGIITVRPGSNAVLPDLPLGSRLRILPNHACAVAAQFKEYQVIPQEAGTTLKTWQRFGGW